MAQYSHKGIIVSLPVVNELHKYGTKILQINTKALSVLYFEKTTQA